MGILSKLLGIKQTVTWQCPYGKVWDLCEDILTQDHVVIGGTTGSGKSTLLHSIMYTALIDSPARKQFIIIDLKGTELLDYRDIPHTIAYADTPEQAVRAVKRAEEIMMNRLNELKRAKKRLYNGFDIYIIIDEMAVLMQTAKAKILEPLSTIMRMGRAARVHVIAATQNPSRSKGGGLPSEIANNCTSALSLRTRSAIESRQTVGISGAEKLPKHGKGIYWNPDGTNEVLIPRTTDYEISERVRYWETTRPVKRWL